MNLAPTTLANSTMVTAVTPLDGLQPPDKRRGTNKNPGRNRRKHLTTAASRAAASTTASSAARQGQGQGPLEPPGPSPHAPGDTASQHFASQVRHARSAAQVQEYFGRCLADGMAPDTVAFNAVIDAQAKHPDGQAAYALSLLKTMKQHGCEPTTVTYTTLIDCCAKCRDGTGRNALALLEEMHYKNLEPNQMTYGCCINAQAKKGSAEMASGVMRRMVQRGLTPDVPQINAVVDAHSKCEDGSAAEALRALNMIYQYGKKPTVVSFSTCIDAQVKQKDGSAQIVLRLLDEMKNLGVVPDAVTFAGAIDAQSKCNDGSARLAVQVLQAMQSFGSQPNAIHFNSVLNACANERPAAVDQAQQVLRWMLELSLQPTSYTLSALLRCARFASPARPDLARDWFRASIGGIGNANNHVIKALRQVLPRHEADELIHEARRSPGKPGGGGGGVRRSPPPGRGHHGNPQSLPRGTQQNSRHGRGHQRHHSGPNIGSSTREEARGHQRHHSGGSIGISSQGQRSELHPAHGGQPRPAHPATALAALPQNDRWTTEPTGATNSAAAPRPTHSGHPSPEQGHHEQSVPQRSEAGAWRPDSERWDTGGGSGSQAGSPGVIGARATLSAPLRSPLLASSGLLSPDFFTLPTQHFATGFPAGPGLSALPAGAGPHMQQGAIAQGDHIALHCSDFKDPWQTTAPPSSSTSASASSAQPSPRMSPRLSPPPGLNPSPWHVINSPPGLSARRAAAGNAAGSAMLRRPMGPSEGDNGFQRTAEGKRDLLNWRR